MKLNQITTEDLNTLVGLLNQEQKDSLVGQLYTDDSYFNPIQDANDNWIISTEEMINCTNEKFMWVKELELITYVPKEVTPIV
jgi:hypothetical protein